MSEGTEVQTEEELKVLIDECRRRMAEIDQTIVSNDRRYMGFDETIHLSMWNSNNEALLLEKTRIAAEIHVYEHKLLSMEYINAR